MQVAPLRGKIRNLCKHQGPNFAFSNVWKIRLRICNSLNTYTLRLFKLPARAGNAHCAGPARPAVDCFALKPAQTIVGTAPLWGTPSHLWAAFLFVSSHIYVCICICISIYEEGPATCMSHLFVSPHISFCRWCCFCQQRDQPSEESSSPGSEFQNIYWISNSWCFTYCNCYEDTVENVQHS